MLNELVREHACQVVSLVGWPGALVLWFVCSSIADACLEVLDEVADEQWVPLRYTSPGRQLREFFQGSGLLDILQLRTADPHLEWSAGIRVTIHRVSGWLPRLPPAELREIAPQWGRLPAGVDWLQGELTHEKWYAIIWRQIHVYAGAQLRCERIGLQAAWNGVWLDVSVQSNDLSWLYVPDSGDEAEGEEEEEPEEDPFL